MIKLYKHICMHICMQSHNDDKIKTSDTDLLEKYTSHFIWKVSKGLPKVLLWEGVGNRAELQHIDPHSIGHNCVSFPVLLGCSTGGLGAHSAGCWFFLPHLISNWLNFLCTKLYNSSTSAFFLWASQIALIQSVHGQGYILIFLDLIHLLFTQGVSYFDCAAGSEVNIQQIDKILNADFLGKQTLPALCLNVV